MTVMPDGQFMNRKENKNPFTKIKAQSRIKKYALVMVGVPVVDRSMSHSVVWLRVRKYMNKQTFQSKSEIKFSYLFAGVYVSG